MLDEAAIAEVLKQGLPNAEVEFSSGQSGERHCSFYLYGDSRRSFAGADLFYYIDGSPIYIVEMWVSDGPFRLQQQGIGKKILSNIVAAAEHIGSSSLSLDTTDVGSYFWARAGFLPKTDGDDDALRHAVRERIPALDISEAEKGAIRHIIDHTPDKKWLWQIADLRDGIGYALLNYTMYPATLNLNDPEAKARLEAYTTLSKQQEEAIAITMDTARRMF